MSESYSKTDPPRDDLFLARRAARADTAAWNEIIERYGSRIYNLALRFASSSGEAEDLTQDIFLKLFRNLDRYRGDVPLVAWALRLSRNLCIDHYRSQRARREKEFVSDEVLEHIPGSEDPGARSQALEDRRLIYASLAEMPAGQAEVVVLCDLQGFTYEEIAAFYEVPVGTIKSRLNRARRNLLKQLERRLGFGPGRSALSQTLGEASPC